MSTPIDPQIARFTKAFFKWEEASRTNPEGFMTAAQVLAANPDDLAEVRAIYFTQLLNELP